MYHTDVETKGEWVAVSETHAYVVGWNSGLQVIDISTPSSPVIVGSFYDPSLPGAVAVSGTHAYVTTGVGLQVIDISSPVSPVIVGSLATPGIATDLGVSETHVYVADSESGIQVVNRQCP